MSKKIMITDIIIDNPKTMSFAEVCAQLDIPESFLLDLAEHGLFNPSIKEITVQTFDHDALRRIQTARRLQRDLDVNTPGVVLALNLLDELMQLRSELDILRRYVY